jgi:hemerythrin-like domain-containing protein
MSRVDFYTKVHKALRASLFELSRRAAATDYGDQHAVQGIVETLRALLARLSAHARHEATFIHPLLESKTGAKDFDAAHDALELEQACLTRLLDAVAAAPADQRQPAGLAFYRALNAFIARYLEHLDREEAVMPELWKRCSDEELRSVMARFGASRPLDEALADIGWMLPALSAPEQAELIGGMTAALARRQEPSAAATPGRS